MLCTLVRYIVVFFSIPQSGHVFKCVFGCDWRPDVTKSQCKESNVSSSRPSIYTGNLMVDLSHSCLICIIFFKSCNETVVYIGILWCVLYDCSLHTPLGIMGNHMHRSKSAWRSSSFNGFLSVYLFFLQETSIPLYVAVFYTIENSVLWSFIHCTVVTKLAAMTWLQCWHRTLPLGAAASPSPVDLAESVGGHVHAYEQLSSL